MKRSRRKDIFRRMLRHEGLEQRSLLAAVIGDSPWQNPLESDDLNCDGMVSPADALTAINALNSGMTGALSGRAAPPALNGHIPSAVKDFLDANGDGQLSPADPLEVINTLNNGLHRGNPDSGLPTEDQPDNQVIDLSHNFAKVRAIINSDGDVDVFQVTPTKTQLNVALFSSGGQVMSVSIVTHDAQGKASAPLATATTVEGSHQPARATVEVTPGTTYFLHVKGDPGVTGPYGLTVLNFTPEDFPLTTDSPLGNDVHPEAPPGTTLTLDHGHASVSSNIDSAGDKDVFDVTVVDGKLVVEAEAEFPLTVTVTDKDGNALTPITTEHEHTLVFNVTASAGPYSITVAAANGTDTGAYHMNVVNVPVGTPDEDESDDDGDTMDHHGPPTPDQIFTKLDANGDGAITLDEVPFGKSPLAETVFANWDENHDGKLSSVEFAAGFETLPPFLPHPPDHPGAPLLTTH